MATCITIDLDTLPDSVAQDLATALVRHINLDVAGEFGYPVVQGTIVQHIPEPGVR